MKYHTIPLEEWSKQFTPAQKLEAQRAINYYAVVAEFKKTRKQLGLTQQQLSNKSGIDRTVIAKIETGARNTTLQSLITLADALDKKLQIKFV